MLPIAQVSAVNDVDDDDVSMSQSSRLNTNTTAPKLKKVGRNFKPSRIDASIVSDKENFPETVMEKKYEPTYRMKPNQDKKFSSDKTTNMIKSVLSSFLENYEYSPTATPSPAEMAQKLPEQIIKHVKTLDFDRYKLVCFVSLGNLADQGVLVSSRCVWDSDFDTCVTYTHTDKDFYCTATVFGLYYE